MSIGEIAVPHPGGWLNVADGIFHNARRRPDHPALVDRGETITYADLADRIARTAGHLQNIGVAPRDIVGTPLNDDADHVVALMALAWMGAVVMPMDVRWTVEEKRRLVAHFGAKFVLIPEGQDAFPDVETVPLDDAWRSGVQAYEGDGNPVRSRDHPLLLSLSSGTTGVPKGPMVTHGHTLSRLYIYAFSLGFNDADRFVASTPLYFGGARYMTMAFLFMGATVWLHPPPYEAQALADTINENGITAAFLVPTLIRRLLDMPKDRTPLMPGLRQLISSGASLYPDERRRIMEDLSPNFFNFYSCTEGGGISLLRPEHPDEVSLSVGRVVFGAEVGIVDENDRPVPTGEVGAIRYRGGSVADGYYRSPHDSAAAFRDGWYYPGDLGRFDEKGFLFLVGRAKDMIIRGGVNIYPVEIEQTLGTHPAVAEAAVVGWPSRERGEEVAAFVVRHGETDEETLRAHCRASLAPYKIPKGVFFVDELPRNPLGKVLKPQLVERLPEID